MSAKFDNRKRPSFMEELNNGSDNMATRKKLRGASVVFTGALKTIRRDAEDIAHELNMSVTGSPNVLTGFAVVGERPGNRKMTAIKQYNIPVLNEEEFLKKAVREGSSKAVDCLHKLGLKPESKFKVKKAPSFEDLEPSPITPPKKDENSFPTLDELGFNETLD